MTIKLHANIESSRQLPDEIVDAMLCIAKQYHPIFLFSENGKFVIAIENDELELKQMNQLPQLQKEVTDLLAEVQSKVIIESISRSVYFPRNIPSRRFSDIVLEDIVNPVLKSDSANPLFKKHYFIFQDRLSSAALRVGRIYDHKIEILMDPNHKDRQTASSYDSDISFDVMQEDIDKVEKPGISISNKFSSSSSSFVAHPNRQIELKCAVDRLQRKKKIKLDIAMEKIAIEILEFVNGIQKKIITQGNIAQWLSNKCQVGKGLEKKMTSVLERKNSFVSLTLKRKVASHGTYEKDRMEDYALLVKQIRRVLSGIKITAQFFPYDANLFLKITLNCDVASDSYQSFEKDIQMCLFAAQLSDDYYLSGIDYSTLLIDKVQHSQEAAYVEASSSSSSSTPIHVSKIISTIGSPHTAAGDVHKKLMRRLEGVLSQFSVDFISPFAAALEIKEYCKALRRACTSTHPKILDLVKALLEFKEELKIDINEPAGYLHCTALHHAARKGNKELYEFLVEKGADPQLKDAEGNSAEDILKQTELSKAASVLKL